MFRPYFNRDIHEHIRTRDEHDLVAQVLRMNLDELNNLYGDLKTQAALRPGFRNSRYCVLSSKAIIFRTNELKKSVKTGMGWGEAALAVMSGAIVGDEFAKRFLRS